jgi:purine-binding chemotaxis protein CheW
MNDLMLIVAIAGQKVALRAADVQSVVEIDVLTPVPCAPPHVAGLSAQRSRVLTVIDPQSALGLGPCPNRQAGAQAAVVIHDGHAYALLLDEVEEAAEARSEPAPVHGHLRGDWARMSYGMIETDHAPLLLLDVAALISGPEEPRAAAA